MEDGGDQKAPLRRGHLEQERRERTELQGEAAPSPVLSVTRGEDAGGHQISVPRGEASSGCQAGLELGLEDGSVRS